MRESILEFFSNVRGEKDVPKNAATSQGAARFPIAERLGNIDVKVDKHPSKFEGKDFLNTEFMDRQNVNGANESKKGGSNVVRFEFSQEF